VRLETRDNGHVDVYADDGTLVGRNLSPALAERWRTLRQVQARVSAAISDQIATRAAAAGVSVSAYVAEVLRQHVAGGELSFARPATGMGAADTETRLEVARAGVAGRQRDKATRRRRTTKETGRDK